jgi:hypothetical protein
MKPVSLAAVLICLVSAPAFAKAVTYTGTLGGQAIVLELTEIQDGPLFGRYSYQSRGADIPLHALSANKYDAVLAEEVPCTLALCERADGNLVLDPPLGGQFSLHYSTDNMRLTGIWRAGASAELPVNLIRFGQRSYDRDDDFFYGSFIWDIYGGAPITLDTSPYDYAKMLVALTEGPLQAKSGATYREVIDPRTKFAFPRVVSLPGGGDIAPLNAMLDQRRKAINSVGFECLNRDYRSGGWMPSPFGTGATSLGGVDKDHISIDYVSDTVITIREAGRSSCGGGAPEDYISYYTYEVRAGRTLDLSRIFKGWDAASNNPTQPLIDRIIAAYRKAPDYNADYAEGCATKDNMIDGLDVSFAEGDVAVFFIDGIEDTGCIGTIISVPLTDIKDLLTDKAADYFPSLK